MILVALISVPLCVASLKTLTNMPCPVDIQIYGGNVPNVGLLERYPEDSKPANRQRCFPAAHASGGFALMALPLLFLGVRSKRIALACGVSSGCIMGGYKMLIGDHFLSHTIISMLLAWLIVQILVLFETHLARGIRVKKVNEFQSIQPFLKR